MPDLVWWLSNFRESAFRLETLPAYSVPQEVEMLAAFMRGENVHLPDDHAWLARVQGHTSAGRRMQRVRLISHPLSDYLRFELSMYPQCVEAGEDIRILDITGNSGEFKSIRDFWLFDQEVAIILRYDKDGHFLGTDEASAIPYLHVCELSLSRSMRLSEYTARAAR